MTLRYIFGDAGNAIHAARIVTAGLTDFCSAFVAVGAEGCKLNLASATSQVNAIMDKAPGTPSPLALMGIVLQHLEALSTEGPLT